jgi:hypothetical protein
MPTLVIAGSVTIIVLNTIFRLDALFINLNTLPTLNILTILVAVFRFKYDILDTIILSRYPITIAKSNKFQPLLKYLVPNANILIIASNPNITEKV